LRYETSEKNVHRYTDKENEVERERQRGFEMQKKKEGEILSIRRDFILDRNEDK
jgi:predicted DNA repair protein MutK